ncbi:MAG TPA: hypothetical protein VFL64_12965 [Rhizobacter sp.]|nr:hypothetical protein [Rhizobacter sp.]
MATNFHLAPPAKTVDGLLAVPIDISTIAAAFTFDAAAQTAEADATITYEVGPTAGNPIFDLRQTPAQAWLDGAVFPVAQLAHHSFGSGSFTDLRVIESVQAAGSVHALRVQYPLALPDSQLGGSYLPALDWLAGPRLRFVFGLSDLNRARYAEAWLPANLIFDQFAISLTISLVNTMVAHELITNGTVTVLGTNQWQIDFPARFTALSPMLEIRAADTLLHQSGSTVLPVSGNNVAIDAWAPSTSSVNLGTQITTIATLLADNENDYGGYAHGNRFTAFFNGSGGMEYEGGTTTSTGALPHEAFHSWYARGIKPASQADGWWDEGWTTFHDSGADDPLAFDFGDPPVLLCSRDPWQRNTAGNAYSDGSRFWQGMASLLGVGPLNNLMGQLYQAFKGQPVSTQQIEEFLLCKSGNPGVVDAFHRFVYGLGDGANAPDLWMRDEVGHGGADFWNGTFWDSPDLWVRTQDDGGSTHQSPEYGQDNWFHARVRNRSTTGTAQHFVVSFHARGFAGTQFSFPDDFLPCMAARAEFDLAPGASRVVKARWPRSLVPSAGTHTCMLASVLTRGDPPAGGAHVWEHNNLAQKNLTVVNLVRGEFFILPAVLANRILQLRGPFDIEIWRPEGSQALDLGLLQHDKGFFGAAVQKKLKPFKPDTGKPAHPPHEIELECGAHLGVPGADKGAMLGSRTPDLVARRFGEAWQLPLPDAPRTRVPVELPAFSQRTVGLRVQVQRDAKPGTMHKIHLVQRHRKSQRIVGGVAVEVHVAKE